MAPLLFLEEQSRNLAKTRYLIVLIEPDLVSNKAFKIINLNELLAPKFNF